MPRLTPDWKGYDKVCIEFLSSQKKSTQHTYKAFLKHVLKFTGMTGQQILDSKRADKNYEWETKVSTFKQWMKTQKTSQGKNYSDNAVNTAVNTLRSFFDYYRTPFHFNQNENRKLNGKAKRVTKDYMLTNEDLAKMVLVGNLREKYVVLSGKSFGLRAGDFASFTYGTFRSINLESEAPIFLGEFQTQKEGITAFPFIDSDALPILKAVLDSNKNKPDNERLITVHEEELSGILQNLAIKANINLGDKHLRFHCFRKYLIDRLSACMSESKWKQIVGKSISEDAYVSSFELRESYSKAMKLTTINGNGKASKQLEEMQSEFQLTKSQLADIIAKQKEDKEKLEKQIGEMYKYFHAKFDPAMELLSEIADTPEGKVLLKKLREAKLEKEYEKTTTED
jgi:hypothetical protein